MRMPANNDEEMLRLRETLAQMRASLESIQAERDAAQGEVRVLAGDNHLGRPR
jgi:hypothetical protein